MRAGQRLFWLLRVCCVTTLALSLGVFTSSQGQETGGESNKSIQEPERSLRVLSIFPRLQATVGAWSDDCEVVYVPLNPVEVVFKVIPLGQSNGARSENVQFDPPSLSFDGALASKTFRFKCTSTGYFRIQYEIKSEEPPIPFSGVKQSLVHVLDKAHFSIVQPSGGKLVAGKTTDFHKIAVSRPLDVVVVPAAEGALEFEPKRILFSSSAGATEREFRVKVPESLPERFHRRDGEGTYVIPVKFMLECPGEGEGSDVKCGVDHVYQPAEFRWEVLEPNALLVEDTILAGSTDTFHLPIAFKYPPREAMLVEIYASGLVLTKTSLQLAQEDTLAVNRDVRVIGRRDNRARCSLESPCLYTIYYVVKDAFGRLNPTFTGKKQQTTTVQIIDKATITLPSNSSVAFVNQPIELTFTWPDLNEHLLQSMDTVHREENVPFEIRIVPTTPNVTVEPEKISFGSSFKATLHAEGLHFLSFTIEGSLKHLFQFKDQEPGVAAAMSIVSYDSFYSQKFSFEEKYHIGGLDKQLNTILRRAFLSRIAAPETIAALGVSHVKGILLYGPPGCGKTTVARQIGKMLSTHPPKVVNGPEIISKYLGESENKVRALFADAEMDTDRTQLHLIVFDEIDALVKPRGRGQGEAADQVYDGIVNTILSKMDGIDRLDNVLIVGTTNRKDLIDSALLRPGRFDVQVEISLPDADGRLQIFRIHTKQMMKNHLISEDVDLKKLSSELTKSFTGAEIEGLVKSAASLAVEDAFIGGKAGKPSFVVTQDHFLKALEDIEPSNLDSKGELEKLDKFGLGKLFDFSREVRVAKSRFMKAVAYGSKSESLGGKRKDRVISILVHGQEGTGKTSFVANLMKNFTQEEYKMEVLSGNLIWSSAEDKIRKLNEAFKSVSSKNLGVILLDDLEKFIEHVDTQSGSYVNTGILSQLRILLSSNVEGSRLLICTAASDTMLKFNLLDFFDVAIELPPVRMRSELKKVVREVAQDYSIDQEHTFQLVDELQGHLPLGIKKVLKYIDLIRTGNKELLPEETGIDFPDPNQGHAKVIDAVANNFTAGMKIFLL